MQNEGPVWDVPSKAIAVPDFAFSPLPKTRM